jgi:hypothetical protein
MHMPAHQVKTSPRRWLPLGVAAISEPYVGAGIQGVRGRCRAGSREPELIDTDADLLAKELNQLIDAV